VLDELGADLKQGRKPLFREYADTPTLGYAANQLEKRSWVSSETVETLNPVAGLCNSTSVLPGNIIIDTIPG
jgi:hypothetical protein